MDNKEWRGITYQDLARLTHRPLSSWMQKLIADVETLLKERNHMCDDATKQREAYELGWAIQAGKAEWADLQRDQNWSEIEALRASLREHMAEIKRLNDCLTWEQHRAGHIGTHSPGCGLWGPRHYECLLREHEALKREHMAEIQRLRAAGRQALDALVWTTGSEDFGAGGKAHEGALNLLFPAITALRATLSWDAMQRLTDVQQEMEQPVTDCHDLEQARAVAISNLLAHFGIASANSDVNVDYLHKQLDDFLTAAIGCYKEGDKLAPPFDRSADTGKTSDHIGDVSKMVASVREDRTVEPVAYIHESGFLVRTPGAVLTPGMKLYPAPPKREPLTDEEIESLADEFLDWNLAGIESFARAIERAHGIGGEE